MVAPYADSLGIIGLCPQGLVNSNGETGWGRLGHLFRTSQGPRQWNQQWTADDLGFIRAAQARVLGEYSVPDGLTYATGFSMGGAMVYELLCEASDTISGFSSVGQGGPFERPYLQPPPCTPAYARPFWKAIGGFDTYYRNGDTVVQAWRDVATQLLGCTQASLTQSTPAPFVTCERYTACAAVTEYCVYEGMQHVYPSVLPFGDYPPYFTDYTGVGASWQALPAAFALWTNTSVPALWGGNGPAATSAGSGAYCNNPPCPGTLLGDLFVEIVILVILVCIGVCVGVCCCRRRKLMCFKDQGKGAKASAPAAEAAPAVEAPEVEVQVARA